MPEKGPVGGSKSKVQRMAWDLQYGAERPGGPGLKGCLGRGFLGCGAACVDLHLFRWWGAS